MPKRVSKRLTISYFGPPIDRFPTPEKESLTISNAQIGCLKTVKMDATKFISSPAAHIAGVQMVCFNSNSMVQTNNGMGIGIVGQPESLTISQTGDIHVNVPLVANTISATDTKLVGNLEADNISLLGTIDTSNVHSNTLQVDDRVEAFHILTENIDGTNLAIVDGLVKNNLVISNNLAVGAIVETPQLSSPSDLSLTVPVNFAINVPNIRYNVDISDIPVVNPPALKFSKIFVVSRNITLNTDSSCNGIEIIIYNKGRCEIVVRGSKLITKIAPCISTKLIYIDFLRTWIIA